MGWVVSFSSRPLNPQARNLYYPIKWGRSGTQSRFGHLKERRISCPCRESSHDSFGVHAVGRSLTDCIIVAPVCSIMDEFCKPVICLCVIVALWMRACVCVVGTDTMVRYGKDFESQHLTSWYISHAAGLRWIHPGKSSFYGKTINLKDGTKINNFS